MDIFRNLVNGELVTTSEVVDVINPADETIAGSYYKCTEDLIKKALISAQDAFITYRKTTISERQELINEYWVKLKENKKNIINILNLESGKPASIIENEFDDLFNIFSYYMEEAKRRYSQVIPDYKNNYLNYTKYSPLGVVVSFLPWNFPISMFIVKLAPVLVAGNTCVIKPSEETPLATAYMGEIFNKVGFPKGTLNIVLGTGEDLGRALCYSKIPRLLTLIGSTEAGLAVIGNSNSSIKRFSLELGGNAPVIVFDDANIDLAVNETIIEKFANAGQICVSPNRIFVHEKKYDEFITKCTALIKTYNFKDESGETSKIIMPVVSAEALKRLLDAIDDAKTKDAKIVIGGSRVNRKGYYIEPTLIKDVTKDMKLFTREIFGPIAAVAKFSDSDDIFKIANDTPAGLASYVFTKDISRALEAEERLDFGNIMINGVHFQLYIPHAGVKESGYGSLQGAASLDSYYDIKRVSLKR